MKNRWLFGLALLGAIAGFVSAYLYGSEKKPLPPVFQPASNPYEKGIYTNGIIESDQPNGANINIFPEVSGTITQIQVVAGVTVRQGAPLLQMDDTVQRAVVAQQKAQAEAALALLRELKAQPRKETLAVARAQVELAAANLKSARDQLDKLQTSYALEPKSVSRDQLDNAQNTVNVASANLGVAQKQFELVRAGAWIYDIQNQQHQYDALSKAYASAQALLGKYTIRAPVDGVVLAVNAAVGSFISAQGAYDTYTAGFDPIIVMGRAASFLAVRCYIDEILIARLPPPPQMKAQLFFRGTATHVALEFVRILPYVVPKVELSNQRTERVDVRVLPILFRFIPPTDMKVYPGQLVDVYLEAR